MIDPQILSSLVSIYKEAHSLLQHKSIPGLLDAVDADVSIICALASPEDPFLNRAQLRPSSADTAFFMHEFERIQRRATIIPDSEIGATCRFIWTEGVDLFVLIRILIDALTMLDSVSDIILKLFVQNLLASTQEESRLAYILKIIAGPRQRLIQVAMPELLDRLFKGLDTDNLQFWPSFMDGMINHPAAAGGLEWVNIALNDWFKTHPFFPPSDGFNLEKGQLPEHVPIGLITPLSTWQLFKMLPSAEGFILANKIITTICDHAVIHDIPVVSFVHAIQLAQSLPNLARENPNFASLNIEIQSWQRLLDVFLKFLLNKEQAPPSWAKQTVIFSANLSTLLQLGLDSSDPDSISLCEKYLVEVIRKSMSERQAQTAAARQILKTSFADGSAALSPQALQTVAALQADLKSIKTFSRPAAHYAYVNSLLYSKPRIVTDRALLRHLASELDQKQRTEQPVEILDESFPDLSSIFHEASRLEGWDFARGQPLDAVLHARLERSLNLLLSMSGRVLPLNMDQNPLVPAAPDAMQARDLSDHVFSAINELALFVPYAAVEAIPATVYTKLLPQYIRLALDDQQPRPRTRAWISAHAIRLWICALEAANRETFEADLPSLYAVAKDKRLTLFTLVEQAMNANDPQAQQEHQAGMQGLVLLARMADLTEHGLDPSVLSSFQQLFAGEASPVRARFQGFLQPVLDALFAPSSAPPAELSGLPLAFLAFELSRVCREQQTVLHSALCVEPAWLPVRIEGRTVSSAAALCELLAARMIDDAKGNPFARLVGNGGLSAHWLSVLVLRTQLDALELARQLSIKPMRSWTGADAQLRDRVQKLQAYVRVRLCTELLLIHGVNPDEKNPLVGRLSYWSARLSSESAAAGRSKPDAPYLPIWIDNANGQAILALTAVAAELTERPLDGRDEGCDIDGYGEDEMAYASFTQARQLLDSAQGFLRQHEETASRLFNEAKASLELGDRVSLQNAAMALSVADHAEQAAAARSSVARAAAELTARRHAVKTAELSAHSSELRIVAAEAEVKRQQKLSQVAELEVSVSTLESQIAELDVRIATRDIDMAKNQRAKFECLISAAGKQLEMSALQMAAVGTDLELLRKLLGIPAAGEPALQISVQLRDSTVVVEGQLAAIAVRVEDSMRGQLDEEQRAAAEQHRKAEALARRNSWIKFITITLEVVGGAAGAIFGGPMGAALGVQLGALLGEVTGGVMEHKSVGDIAVGLSDNVLAIAGTLGFNPTATLSSIGVDGASLLEQLGSGASADLSQLAASLDKQLPGVLQSLPRYLDTSIFDRAVGGIADLLPAGLSRDLLSSTVREALQQAGQSVPPDLTQFFSPSVFEVPDREKLLQLIEQKLDAVLPRGVKDALKALDALTTSAAKASSAAGRLAQILVCEASDAASQFQYGEVARWLTDKRAQQATWNQVQEEAESLLSGLFPNAVARAQLLTQLELALVDPKTIQGKFHELLGDWQAELDRRLGEIKKVPPPAAVDDDPVATADNLLAYVGACSDLFSKTIVPWLRGEDNDQRTALVKKLNETAMEHRKDTLDIEKQQDALKGLHFDDASAGLSIESAEDGLRKAKLSGEKSEYKHSQSILLAQSAKFVVDEAAAGRDAAKEDANAAREHVLSARAESEAAQAELDSKQYLLAASEKRSVAALRITSLLSRSPATLPDGAPADWLAVRSAHAFALQRALVSYRELRRAVRMFQKSEAPEDSLLPPIEKHTSGASVSGSWADVFQKVVVMSDPRAMPRSSAALSPVIEVREWQFTPEQIAALLSPEGFRLCFLPFGDEEPLLFTAPLGLERWLSGNGFAKSPWAQWFQKNGLSLSDAATVKVTGSGVHGPTSWRIVDPAPRPVFLSTTLQTASADAARVIDWELDGEPLAYWVRKGPTALSVGRDIFIGEEPGRSPLPEALVYSLNFSSDQSRTGRIHFIALHGVGIDGAPLEGQYVLQAEHQGDVWLAAKADPKRIEPQRWRRRTLIPGRLAMLKRSELEENLVMLASRAAGGLEALGDPSPFLWPPIPLSGTLRLRLKPGASELRLGRLLIKVLLTYNA